MRAVTRVSGLAVGLLAFGVITALPAAAQKLYTGSWVAESFGNDNFNGTGESNYFSVFGMPQGILCNPNQPPCPLASTPVTSMGNVFSALGTNCTPVANFGGGVRPAKGATPVDTKGVPLSTTPRYRNPAFFTPGGAPNATVCSATSTVGGNPANFAVTTNSPLRGPVMKGAPLTGTGLAATTGMNFKLASGDLARTTVGEFNNLPPYLYSYTYASLSNDDGAFAANGGPGAFNIIYKQGANKVANVVVKQGANKFGGVMKLLGQLTTKVCYFRNGGCSLGGNNWRYDAIGAKAQVNGAGVVTKGYIATYTAMYYHTALMQQSTVFVSGGRFPWTTGSVTLTAVGRGPHKTIERRKGFDKRTVGGNGKIQLVTPIITRWLQPASNFETGGIGILKLEFAPEPGAWAMLAGGLSLLVVLFRARGR